MEIKLQNAQQKIPCYVFIDIYDNMRDYYAFYNSMFEEQEISYHENQKITRKKIVKLLFIIS